MNSYSECKEIVELDLDPIKVKLMHEESGEGWTLEQASVVETEYRRFLYLMKIFPNEMAAPSMDVDTFWHYHILDTMKYAHDCQQVFGFFLHHFPYAGLRGDNDLVAHEKLGERMVELYEQTFGETYRANLIDVGSRTISRTINVGRENGAFPASTGAGKKPAFSLTPGIRAKTAFSLATGGNAKTAFSLTPGIRAKTAFSLTAGTNDATAFSLTPGAKFVPSGTRQDEKGSTDLAGLATGLDTPMDSFFSTRPRLPAPVRAN